MPGLLQLKEGHSGDSVLIFKDRFRLKLQYLSSRRKPMAGWREWWCPGTRIMLPREVTGGRIPFSAIRIINIIERF